MKNFLVWIWKAESGSIGDRFYVDTLEEAEAKVATVASSGDKYSIYKLNDAGEVVEILKNYEIAR